MPTTNRPFFANFFAAFRTQSYFHKASAGAITSPVVASTAPLSTCSSPSPTSSSPQTHTHTPSRQIPGKAQPQTTSSSAAVAAHAAATFQSARSPPPAAIRHQSPPTVASRHRRPPTTAARQHSTSPTPGSRSPTAQSPTPFSAPPRGSFQRSRTPSETRIGGRPVQRRESDSSGSDSGGLKDRVGSQGWYIGGRTPTGEESFYRLGMVKRWNSADRLSLDRLSI